MAHQLIGLNKDDKPVFDSIIVVTDRRILDKQIRDTIKQFAQVGATVGAVTEGSKQLREFIEGGKKIIISTVQKFPFILDDIGSEHRGRRFAIIIDEAHSSQGGRTSAAMSMALSEGGAPRRTRDGRGQDQPHHGGAQAAAERQLLRLHRDAEEQDARDLRRALRRGRARSSTAPSTATR